jgi:hypothetical protein
MAVHAAMASFLTLSIKVATDRAPLRANPFG